MGWKLARAYESAWAASSAAASRRGKKAQITGTAVDRVARRIVNYEQFPKGISYHG